MGIDLSWPREWKRALPEAFSPKFPEGCSVIFYDGQLKLQMPAGLVSWTNWIHLAFTVGINDYFTRPGVETIVLAFDDYAYSPLAKGPTQAKRKKASEGVVDWNEFRPLPPTIPVNYAKLLFNSAFKRRVVMHIMQEVMDTVRFQRPGQRLIFDYTKVQFLSYEEPHVLRSMHFEKPLGECDVKVVRYCANPGQHVLWIASDSDYLCVALNALENHKKSGDASNIFIRRMVVRLPELKQEKKKGREYEFVNCNMLRSHIQKTLVSVTPAPLQRHVIAILSAVIALCGCDFCEGIPWMTATAFKKNQALMWKAVCESTILQQDTGLVSLDARIFADTFMVAFWKQSLFKGVVANTVDGAFETLRESLLNSKLSDVKRKALISAEQLHTNVRNVNWVVFYWKFPEVCPCALSGDYGYIRDTKRRKVIFSTSDPLPGRRN
jgi:hypothetical protein